MRRPVGVTISAVVLGFIAVLGIFGILVSLVVTLFIPNPILSSYFRPFIVASDCAALVFLLYCVWTVVDLFRMRNWARISIVVIGSLVVLFSVAAGGGTLAARPYAAMIPQGPHPIDLTVFLVGLAVFYFLVSLIGVWWIVYFNLTHVRGAFRGAQLMVTHPDTLPPGGAVAILPVAAAPPSGWRIVIIVWACLMLFSVLSIPLVPILHFPLLIGGAILTGSVEYIVVLVFAAAALYMGIGLLRKWRAAWYVALVWQILALVNMVTFLVPGSMTRLLAYQEQIMSRALPPGTAPPFPIASMFNGPFLFVCMIPGIAIVVLFFVALFRCKADYLGD